MVKKCATSVIALFRNNYSYKCYSLHVPFVLVLSLGPRVSRRRNGGTWVSKNGRNSIQFIDDTTSSLHDLYYEQVGTKSARHAVVFKALSLLSYIFSVSMVLVVDDKLIQEIESISSALCVDTMSYDLNAEYTFLSISHIGLSEW